MCFSSAIRDPGRTSPHGAMSQSFPQEAFGQHDLDHFLHRLLASPVCCSSEASETQLAHRMS